MSYLPPQPTVKRRVRTFTWIILAVNVLVLTAVIAYVSSRHPGSENDNGAGFLVLAIVQFWTALDIILGTAWLLTRQRKPAVVSQQSSAAPFHRARATEMPPV